MLSFRLEMGRGKFLKGQSRVESLQSLAYSDGWKVSLTTLMNERVAVGDAPGPDFDDIFELTRSLELDEGPAICNPAVREKLADWYVRRVGLKCGGTEGTATLPAFACNQSAGEHIPDREKLHSLKRWSRSSAC